jgi:glycine/D-amino acid oxidase-like deaminating enzyme
MKLEEMNAPVWDDGRGAKRGRVEGVVRAEVCVVGLGGSGLAALEELRARGVAAVGVDAAAVGAGAAGRNGGFVLAGLAKFYHETVAQVGREVAAALYRATADEIRRQAAEWPQVFRLNGSLRLAADAAEIEDCRAHAAALRADGFPVEWYRGAEGEGLLLPTDGVFQPLARARAWAARVEAAGARLFERSPVRVIEPGRVVTDGGEVRCDRVIVAADGRLEAIFRAELAGRVRTARLQMLATAPAPEVRFPRAVYWRHGFEYWQQLADGRVALGGFRDTEEAAEWTERDEPTVSIQARLERFLRERLGVRAAVTHRWAASVGYTPDGLPILEEVRPGVWALGGYNGTGNIVGALGGRAAAARATGGPAPWVDLLARARAAARHSP